VTAVVQVMSGLFTILVILCFMFYINWQLALVALVPVPVIVYASFVFRKYAQHSFLEIRRKIADLSAFMQESITGIRVVQLFGREREREDRFAERNADHRDEWLRQVRNFAVYFPVVEFLSDLSLALILMYTGVRMLSMGEEITHVASIGTFVGYVFWSQRLYMPIRSLADRYNLLLEAMASSERVFQLLDTPEDIRDKADARKAERLEGRVTFDGVWFAYEQENWVIRDLNVDIAPGKRVAIVGHTGAGKSTFINLVSRFYDVQRGAVCVDGTDVRDYEQATLRSHIGIVLQDVFLFTGSIEDNIRLGDEEMDDAWIRQCAEAVNAAPFIEQLPGKYQYNVGERGRNLSTGQRQLVAFARTLAHNPSILVLDEATSSIDTETEGLIQDAMETLMEGRTSIVIAHRLSTIQHADRILVMHHGELRESGTHDELLSQGGLYRRLYELQFSGLEKPAGQD
jgi:ABC-type multidrug transport system fused ATPase/permease subunit